MLGRVINILAIITPLHAIFYVAGLYATIGLYIPGTVYRASFFALIVTLFYLMMINEKKEKGKFTVLDVILLLMALIPTLYYIVFNSRLINEFTVGEASVISIIMFFSLLISLFVAGKRSVGIIMPIIVLFFLLQFTYGDLFPGIFNQVRFGLEFGVANLFTGENGIWGFALGVVATVVMVFVIFSQMLIVTGGGKFFIDLALSLVGWIRGGPAQSAVVASAFFGSLSGSGTSNVVGTGSVTIPLMKRIGYRPEFAGAVEAVASNGGAIMPPVMGAVIFLMADYTGIPYAEIVVAALLPALLYYFALMSQVYLEAVRLNLPRMPKAEVPRIRDVLRDGWYYLVPLVVLILLIVVAKETPERSVLVSMLVLFLITLPIKEKRLNLTRIKEVLIESAKSTPIVIVSVALAGIIIACISSGGLGFKLSFLLVELSMGHFTLLAILGALASFIMGLGLSVTPAYLMLAALVCPALINMGAVPASAHLFAVYWGLASFITPPVAIVSFVAASLAKSAPMKTAFLSMRLGIATYIVPFIFLFQPALLLGMTDESIWTTIYLFFTAMVGIIAFAAAAVGYVFNSLPTWTRVLLLVCAILLLIPEYMTDIVGYVILIFLALYIFKTRNKEANKDLTVEGITG